MKKLTLIMLLLLSPALWAKPVDLELTDLDGKQFKLSDYRGKWVVLNYWATWCPPCLEEIPELVHFHENHKESDAVVIGIDVELLPPEQLRDFVEDNFITYPIVPLLPNEVQAFENVENFPTTYLIDPEGTLVERHVGAVTAEAIEHYINNYVPEKRASRE